jgi:arylsulfatase
MAKHGITRRGFLKAAGVGAAAVTVPGLVRLMGSAGGSGDKPNFIVFFTDDQGYQDLGCFGSGNYGSAPKQPPAISTPNIDRMATEGMKFTDFYVSASVCSASRAAIVTGCYNRRVNVNGAYDPSSTHGLNPSEITIAEVLKPMGYATAWVGKWHLGHLATFLPTRQGFDYYFGIPYSNDQYPGTDWGASQGYPPLPLIEGETKVETNPDQRLLTQRYTQKAYQFMKKNKANPFFLFLSYTAPHWPIYNSERFRKKSTRSYSDAIMEIDWSVGVILNAVKELGIDNKTLVIFVSDNGPWLLKEYDQRGCALPLREGKWSVYEGGMRVPCVMRYPGYIPANTACAEVASTIDILPTFALLAGTTAPTDRTIDGKDIRPLMTAQSGATSPHTYYFMEDKTVRSGKWKLHKAWTNVREYVWNGSAYVAQSSDKPDRLFDLSTNKEEDDTKNLAAANPTIVNDLKAAITAYNTDIAANSRPEG